MRELNKKEENILKKILDIEIISTKDLFFGSIVYKDETNFYQIKKELICYEFLNKILTDITENGYTIVPF